MARDEGPNTLDARDDAGVMVCRLRLEAIEGPAAGRSWELDAGRATLGSHPSNHVVIDDAAVSRFHCELVRDERGARVRDIGSKNGTLLDGVRVVEAFVRDGSTLRVGDSRLSIVSPAGSAVRLPLSARTSFGGLVGGAAAMRAAYALLERAAASDATVLLDGETGTGKGEAAEAIHRAGRRGRGPFVVLDCGAIAENLIESELFGHERGAFTGADARRAGAFEQADGGTIFLDEIGELPAELQPKLLRVLENRQIRRVGSSTTKPIDVRVVAATNRDLRAEVNSGRFRSDLYFRLAVVPITLPPLRQRPEDVGALAAIILERLGATPEQRARMAAPEVTQRLARAAWPGNVRELRNYLERCLVYDLVLPVGGDEPPASAAVATGGARLPFSDARVAAIAAFERAYLEELLAASHDKMADAAAAAGIGRVYLYKLLVKHGLK